MPTENAQSKRVPQPWSYHNIPPDENTLEGLKTPQLHSLEYVEPELFDHQRQLRAFPLDSMSFSYRSGDGPQNDALPHASLDHKGYGRPSRRRALASNNSGNIYGYYAFTDPSSSGHPGLTNSHLPGGFAVSEQAEDPAYIIATPSKVPWCVDADLQLKLYMDQAELHLLPILLDAAVHMCSTENKRLCLKNFRV